jgi:hypothetical protein
MNKKSVVLAFAAGVLGGMASHYLSPQLVHAQSQALPATEIRAASFVLVNEKGVVLGTLAEDAGRPAIRLFDQHGREIWSAGGKIEPRSTSVGR